MRLERVFKWLADHLDDALDFATVADVACLSPYHFHRIYHSMQGETVTETVRAAATAPCGSRVDHRRVAGAAHRAPRGLR